MGSESNSLPRYSSSVRVGNWYENSLREQDEFDDIMKFSKKKRTYSYYTEETDLAPPSPYIRFGDVVQLVASEMKRNPKYDCLPVLSIAITNEMIINGQPINDECEVCVAPSLEPCVRNSFKIMSANEKNRTNEILKFNQNFILQCIQTENNPDGPLLLYCPPNCENLTNISLSSYKNHIYHPLGLISRDKTGGIYSVPKWHCFWKCVHRQPICRFEAEGLPVPSDTPLIIRHLATSQNLATETYHIDTAFGRACLASVKTCQDSHRIEQWPNIWNIVISKKVLN